MCDSHTMIHGRHLKVNKKEVQKGVEPLFRRVPQAMVSAWEKENLADPTMKLEWAHARISRLQSMRVSPSVLISLTVLIVVGWVCISIFFNPILIETLVLLLWFSGLSIYANWLSRSHKEEEQLQATITNFEDHFNAIKLAGNEDSDVWDVESRVRHLITTAVSVLDEQDNVIPSARKDESVSMERLMDKYGYYRFLQDHLEEYRAGLGNFGEYFNIPTPRAIFDTARAELPEHVRIRRESDRIISEAGIARFV